MQLFSVENAALKLAKQIGISGSIESVVSGFVDSGLDVFGSVVSTSGLVVSNEVVCVSEVLADDSTVVVTSTVVDVISVVSSVIAGFVVALYGVTVVSDSVNSVVIGFVVTGLVVCSLTGEVVWSETVVSSLVVVSGITSMCAKKHHGGFSPSGLTTSSQQQFILARHSVSEMLGLWTEQSNLTLSSSAQFVASQVYSSIGSPKVNKLCFPETRSKLKKLEAVTKF